MCPMCQRLRAQNAELRGRIEQLKMIIRDMGAPVDFDEDERLEFSEGVSLITHDPEDKA